MDIFILGLLLFFASHSVSIINHRWRDRMVARLGLQAWQGLYSLVALGGFILLVWGYGLARSQAVLIYQAPTWGRHLSLLLMLPVFPLLLAAYLPGRIQAASRHPMLLATLIWALAHLLANGNLADLLLFGGFLLWALLELLSLRRRQGPAVQGAPAGAYNDLIVLIAGVALYGGFVFGLHAWLFGAAPLSL